ncbi:MAG TPA: hypothetical protein VHY08_21250, partial [Bacillota bacterium]|nr:hypothetical protein [Bacillota bacterium]
MPLDKLFRLRMYAEVRFHYVDSVDHIGDIVELTKNKYNYEEISVDELVLKPIDDSTIGLEVKIKPQRLSLAMEKCPSYEFFVETLSATLSMLSRALTPQDIINIGVQGLYLYSVDSIQKFSQVVSSWSKNYSAMDPSSVGISDLGVNVALSKEGIRMNIMCRLLPLEQVYAFFPNNDGQIDSNFNL